MNSNNLPAKARRMASISTVLFALVAVGVVTSGQSSAEDLSGPSLLKALRSGGYVVLMRHASSPHEPPDAEAADALNTRRERQLDDAGRSSAIAMGAALRRLHIPVGRVLSSPTYRAMQTVRLAQFGDASIFPELGDEGHSMMADATGVRGAWLRAKIAEVPQPGLNTLVVTHLPNIVEALGASVTPMADGEALVLRPDGKGGSQLVARVRMEAWEHLDSAP